MQDHQTPPDREHVEQEILSQVRAAGETYRIAKEHTKKTLGQFADLPLGHPDGNHARRHAAGAEQRALEEYRRCLKTFTDLVLYDREPAEGTPGNPLAGPASAALTPRETEVLRLIVNGKSSKEIASALGISFKTAVTHRASIMSKLNVHEVASVVREAIERGLV